MRFMFLAFAAAAVGCGSNGAVHVTLTDDPAAASVKQLLVTVNEVRIHDSGEDTATGGDAGATADGATGNGWIVLCSTVQTFDLLQLTNGRTMPLCGNQSITVPSGPCGLAVDASHVWWGHLGGGLGTQVGRASLDGNVIEPNFINGASQPCGVAVDGLPNPPPNQFRYTCDQLRYDDAAGWQACLIRDLLLRELATERPADRGKAWAWVWWLCESAFTTTKWDTWSTSATWVDVQSGRYL